MYTLTTHVGEDDEMKIIHCRHGNESCSSVVLVYILIFGFRNTFSYSFPILQFSLELLTLQNPLLIGI